MVAPVGTAGSCEGGNDKIPTVASGMLEFASGYCGKRPSEDGSSAEVSGHVLTYPAILGSTEDTVNDTSL